MVRLSLLFALLVPAPAFASEVSHTTTIPEQPVPYSQDAVLPKFDAALGILRQVEITVSCSAYGSYGIENTNAAPGSTPFNVATNVMVFLPAGSMSNPSSSFQTTSPTLAAFDGLSDFAGASGVSGNFASVTTLGSSITKTIVETPLFPSYVGPSGSPGTLSIMIAPFFALSYGVSPGFSTTHTFAMRAVVQVKYVYDSLPTTFCYSATWDGCPCSNTGSPGHGCANSLVAAGGRLSFGGVASLSNDTLFLQGSSMTNGVALYFQGTGMQYSGTPYGDGLLCIGGSLVRLGLLQNLAGGSSVPSPGNPSLSVHGGITLPGTRTYYQVQYRNALPFCTPATFNVTNAVAVAWAP